MASVPPSALNLLFFMTASGDHTHGGIAIWGSREQTPCLAAAGSEMGSV